jgi:autophagy-related protein 9
MFHQRLNMSYPFASRYLDQFPKVKMVQFARFVAFVAGAIVSVLAVATLSLLHNEPSFSMSPSSALYGPFRMERYLPKILYSIQNMPYFK